MEDQTCFECLQRRIHEDFSDNLIFCYGISDSALPFGSKAVVQIANGSGGVSDKFVLVRVRNRDNDCLTQYVDDNMQKKDDIVVDQQDDYRNISLTDEAHCGLVRLGSEASLDGNFQRFSSVRIITALAPVAYIGIGSYSEIENLAQNFLSGLLEDHVLSSLNLLIEGKSTGRDGVNFLSLVGVPSFSEKNIPGCIRHPNIVPVLGMLKTNGYINLLASNAPFTLENILHYSPDVLQSEWHIRFLIYQILSGLSYIHGLGIAHGNICPSSVMLSSSCWCWLNISDVLLLKRKHSLTNKEECLDTPWSLSCTFEDCPCRDLYADLMLSCSVDWQSNFKRWWRGEMSNFEYLLVLNRLAGRRWGDHTFHTVMPWVIDFSTKPDENSDAGWRDLGKSKWRLAKGDEQLDFTYSTSEIPHHVSDECLSELAVCSYKARRLPLSILRTAVRSVYEPNEYPSSMQRLYQWTPDECIPEFYSDPRIFSSLHSGMSDLAVPPWANGPEEFIKLHRNALESNRVSLNIHHWIDITFGYKMSGQAAIAAKNVMLPSSEPSMPKVVGRHQLFTQPHPMRHVKQAEYKQSLLLDTANLQELEVVASFCEHARHLSPLYRCNQQNMVSGAVPVKGTQSKNFANEMPMAPSSDREFVDSSDIDLSTMLECLEVDDNTSLGFQELLLWRQKSCNLNQQFEDVSDDVFSIGCLLSELYLKKPLFDPATFAEYMDGGLLPGLMQELPPNAAVFVETCIQRDWRRRPSAKCLLESPYFPATVRSSYLFLSAIHILAKGSSHLQYAAKFARQGALKIMGSFAVEMCAPYCIPFIVAPLNDDEAEWAFVLLKEFMKCLNPQAIKALILPAIQKILQAADYSHLKVSLLQDSFIRELWNRVGKQAYLEVMHPLVVANLSVSTHKNSASAASVLLIGSSEELGVPITFHQTLMPLIHCFGKGLCADGIDVLVRIGGLLGEDFIVRHLLPALRNVILSCIGVSNMDKPEPMQSWNTLAIIDSLVALDGVVAALPVEVIVQELLQDGSCLHVQVLKQSHLDLPVLQVAATTLIEICTRIGPDFSAPHVLPQLKELFDELVFSQEKPNGSSSSRNITIPKSKLDTLQVESRMDLVLLLYPSFASLFGIEKLRQCCATWLLLEQFLQRAHNWKWECTGEPSRTSPENANAQRLSFGKISTSDYNPAKMLLNGVGWSIPQSQGRVKNLINHKQLEGHQEQPTRHVEASSLGKCEPWFWYPGLATSWDGPDFLGRVGGLKDEKPWKVRASVIHSVRAHPGALRSLVVCDDECTVFTGGVGPGFKGTVQKWELPRVKCMSGYYGHDEVVNDINPLSSTGRIASCDGTIHIWNGQTAKLISVHAEQSTSSLHPVSNLSSASKVNTEHINMLNSNTLSSGVLSSTFGGNSYTCMHYLDYDEKLIAGTGNGSLRFIDVNRDQKLQLWKTESVEASFSSLISAICSCGSNKVQARKTAASRSWIAAGLSSGHCRLLDVRSGSIIASWSAHDGFITKLAAPEDHLLVSSSLDKSLRVWDLRRIPPSKSNVFRGYPDGVSGFSIWGQDVISISRNKIGVSSLSRSINEDGHQRVSLQKLYTVDRGTINFSGLLSISILPFSRLFLVGTEDGYLKICC